MSTNEIAKLESRWRENRQGLTFAPLAEAYRKMKEPQRALEILGEGLGLHPDYIPASIVLGRCHLDLGDDAAAEDAFNRVLALDGENVIALKALAEITERHLRFDEAEGWLRQLLAIDRSNEEARAQLVRVEDSRRNTAGIARDESGAAVDAAIITEDRPALVATPPAPVEAAPAEAAPAPAEGAPVEAADEGHDFEPAETMDVEPMAEIEPHGETVYTAFDTADAVGAVEGLEPREFVSPDIAVPIL
jgi:tetratricopeptide (TPR) repeat protein